VGSTSSLEETGSIFHLVEERGFTPTRVRVCFDGRAKGGSSMAVGGGRESRTGPCDRR